MKLQLLTSLSAVSVIILSLYSPDIVRATDDVYQITEAIPTVPITLESAGQTFFETEFDVHYETGQLSISRDEEGNAPEIFEVADAIELTIHRPDATTEIFVRSFNPDCFIQTMRLSEPELEEEEEEEDWNPWEISELFGEGINHVQVRLYHECSDHTGSVSLYLVNIGGSGNQVAPFLRLPWNYEAKGLSFEDAALTINSYFDHTYPLLSTSLVGEPKAYEKQVMNYEGLVDPNFHYSSHDGYDYGKGVGAGNGADILAAAAGCATYGSSTAGGNVIKINHGNGYQSRYLHMQKEGLITEETTVDKCVQVTQGQVIGKVGYTGNIRPNNENGAHIHFMVVHDKNGDGNFSDNIPDGLVDPFGWQGTGDDPWEVYAFTQGKVERTGDKSFYMWQQPLPKDSNQTNDQTTRTEFTLNRYSFSFPEGSANEPIVIEVEAVPWVQPTDWLSSLGHTVEVTARNALRQLVTSLQKSFSLQIGFSNFDLEKYNPETLAIYSSEDGVTWQKEETVVNWDHYVATGEINHLSFFALMAERKDILPPTTTAVLDGQAGQSGWYRSGVKVTLQAADNEGGLGIDYTAYRIDESEWLPYSEPVEISEPGRHTIHFYSSDNDENVEEEQSVELRIDLESPEARLQLNTQMWVPEMSGVDYEGVVSVQTKKLLKNGYESVITDQAGNTLTVGWKLIQAGKLRLVSWEWLQYDSQPRAMLPGNVFASWWATDRRSKKLSTLSQTWWYRDPRELHELLYTGSSQQTTIWVKHVGAPVQKSVESGIVWLQVSTNKGELEVDY